MGEKEERERLDREILERLARVEAKQDLQLSQWTKVENHAIAIAKLESSTKSMHHRLDAMQEASKDLKEDLTKAITEQIAGIYRTAALLGAVSGFFVGIIMWILNR